MFLFFSLACISGFIGYHKTIGFNTITRFLSALFAWLTIIALNEVIQCFFPNSEAQIEDIVYNMKGVLIGLWLSIPWFWKQTTRNSSIL
jgi:VanZ family protein